MSNSTFLPQRVQRIGIIGAGVAGLVAAKTLRDAGFTCEIVERGQRIGGVWAAGYRGFGLQTPRGLYDLPDWPMPASFPELPSGEQIQAHLESYARRFGIDQHIHLGRQVTRVAAGPGGQGWVVTCRDTQSDAEEQRSYDFVIMATGLYSHPQVPELPDRERFGGAVLHSSGYRDAEVVRDRKVIVVGFGKSALDIATDASRHARSVTLLYREAHWPLPVKVLGLVDLRKLFLNRFATGFLPPYQRPAPWEARLHRSTPWLVHGFWRAVEGVLRAQLRLGACNITPDTPLERDLFAGGILPMDETMPLIRRRVIEPLRGTIERYTASGVQLSGGRALDADVIIHATGWRCQYGILPETLQRAVEDDGLYLYRHILHPEVPGLAFVGWASTYSNSLTSHLAAVWLSRLLTGRMQLPGRGEMLREIDEMKQWKRSFMPALGCRGSMLQVHLWHFHDDLLRDMGEQPKRKRNALAELFADYSPADYAALFEDRAGS